MTGANGSRNGGGRGRNHGQGSDDDPRSVAFRNLKAELTAEKQRRQMEANQGRPIPRLENTVVVDEEVIREMAKREAEESKRPFEEVLAELNDFFNSDKYSQPSDDEDEEIDDSFDEVEEEDFSMPPTFEGKTEAYRQMRAEVMKDRESRKESEDRARQAAASGNEPNLVEPAPVAEEILLKLAQYSAGRSGCDIEVAFDKWEQFVNEEYESEEEESEDEGPLPAPHRSDSHKSGYRTPHIIEDDSSEDEVSLPTNRSVHEQQTSKSTSQQPAKATAESSKAGTSSAQKVVSNTSEPLPRYTPGPSQQQKLLKQAAARKASGNDGPVLSLLSDHSVISKKASAPTERILTPSDLAKRVRQESSSTEKRRSTQQPTSGISGSDGTAPARLFGVTPRRTPSSAVTEESRPINRFALSPAPIADTRESAGVASGPTTRGHRTKPNPFAIPGIEGSGLPYAVLDQLPRPEVNLRRIAASNAYLADQQVRLLEWTRKHPETMEARVYDEIRHPRKYCLPRRRKPVLSASNPFQPTSLAPTTSQHSEASTGRKFGLSRRRSVTQQQDIMPERQFPAHDLSHVGPFFGNRAVMEGPSVESAGAGDRSAVTESPATAQTKRTSFGRSARKSTARDSSIIVLPDNTMAVLVDKSPQSEIIDLPRDSGSVSAKGLVADNSEQSQRVDPASVSVSADQDTTTAGDAAANVGAVQEPILLNPELHPSRSAAIQSASLGSPGPSTSQSAQSTSQSDVAGPSNSQSAPTPSQLRMDFGRYLQRQQPATVTLPSAQGPIAGNVYTKQDLDKFREQWKADMFMEAMADMAARFQIFGATGQQPDAQVPTDGPNVQVEAEPGPATVTAASFKRRTPPPEPAPQVPTRQNATPTIADQSSTSAVEQTPVTDKPSTSTAKLTPVTEKSKKGKRKDERHRFVLGNREETFEDLVEQYKNDAEITKKLTDYDAKRKQQRKGMLSGAQIRRRLGLYTDEEVERNRQAQERAAVDANLGEFAPVRRAKRQRSASASVDPDYSVASVVSTGIRRGRAQSASVSSADKRPIFYEGDVAAADQYDDEDKGKSEPQEGD